MTRSRDIADQQDNLGGAVAPFVAGKNKLINGDFSQWQRGVSFTNPAILAYTADRYFTLNNGTSPTVVVSQESLLPDTIPGYNSEYYFRYNQTVAGTGATLTFPFAQRIENAKTLAGQTITFSLWVKSDSARSFTLNISYNLGTGGSTAPSVLTSDTKTSATTWQRHTFTTTLPTLSGLTVGAGSFISVYLSAPVNVVQTWDIWGNQFEAGSVATPFTPAGGGFPGAELALCQRYYYRTTANGYQYFCTSANFSSGSTLGTVTFPVTMRTSPSLGSSASNTFMVYQGSTIYAANAVPASDGSQPNNCGISLSTGSGLTLGFAANIRANNTTAFLEFNGEL